MPPASGARPDTRAVLDPVDRSSEVLFGLVMALTFTATIEVATAGRADVRTLLIGAFGCNLAWGIVDGVMFVITRQIEKHRVHAQARAVQTAAPAEAVRILEQELPADWAALLEPAALEAFARRLRTLPPSLPPRLTAGDLRGGLAVFLLVLLSTVPVTLPFLLFDRAYVAARVSNATALVMLLVIGARLGRHAGRSPLLVGLAMMVIGVLLSAAAIRFGG